MNDKAAAGSKKWRNWIIGGYAVIVVIIAVLWGYSLFSPIDSTEERQEYDHLLSLANAGTLLFENSDMDAQDAVSKLASEEGMRVTLIGSDGTVISDSMHDSSTMENHGSRPEVIAALSGQTGRDRRVSATTGYEALYVAVPTIYHGENVALRVSMPMSQVGALAEQFRLTGFVLLIVAVAIAVAASLFVTSRASQPVDHLTRVRTDFVANASHELKTPVAGIMLLSESIETASKDGDMDAVEVFAHRLHDETKRLQNLVNGLLDLSRLEDTNARGHSDSKCDFHSIVITSFEAHVAEAHRKGVTFALFDDSVCGKSLPVPLTGTDATVIADNLIENAIRYTPNGSISVILELDDDTVVFKVSDTGIGIAAADQERIFERFFRVDKARSREQGGTGLGLSLVRHAVEKAHGSVSVDSRLNEGSTFMVRLPLTKR